MLFVLLCLGVAAGESTAARCAPADAMAYVEVPAPRISYARASTSAFKQAARALIPESLRKRDDPQLWTMHDDGETHIWPVPRCTAPARPLLEDLRYTALMRAAPDADLRGHVDLQRFYRRLRRQSLGSSYEQALRRLGVHRLQSVQFNARLVNANQWAGGVDIHGLAPEGFFAALAAPAAPIWPEGVPTSSTFASMWVLPGKMWLVGESVLAGVYPLQYTLARVQLDAMEQERGQRWAEDILGDTPRLWSLYQIYGKGTTETLLVLGAQDGHAAEGFLRDALNIVASVGQGLQLRSGTVRKVKTLTLQWQGRHPGSLYIGFLPHALILAPSSEALAAHLAGDGKAGVWSGGSTPALAFGQGDSARLLAQVLDSLHVAHPTIPSMGRSLWRLVATAEGWHTEVLGTL